MRRGGRITALLASFSTLLLFAACNAEQSLTAVDPAEEMAGEVAGAEQVTDPSFAVTSTVFALTPSSVTMAQPGDTSRLSAVKTDGSGETVSATWTTSNEGVVWVGSSGRLVAKGIGTATVTATHSTYGSSSATVTVGGTGSTATTTTTTTTTTGTVGTTATAAVASITLTPSPVNLTVGQKVQMKAVAKDQAGNTLSGVTFVWTTSNVNIATISSTGVVTGVAPGQIAIAAANGLVKTRTTVTVAGTAGTTTTTSGGAAGAAPVAKGIWISKAELDALPMSGTGWTGTGEVKNTADASWTPQAVEVQSGQRYNLQAMAGALVFARMYPNTAAEAYRTKVVQAIRNVMAQPIPVGASATASNRFLGTWAITADLINLPAYDPALNTQFRAWLTQKLDQPYEGGKTVRYQLAHANNQGSWATFSIAAASAYLGDRATLDKLALRYRRWLGNTSVAFTLKFTDDQSFQLNPGSSSTWVGINPKGAARDGNNFDGLQPSDQNRGAPELYDAASFPNSFASVRYNETSIHGVLGAVLILHRAGYTDLVGASDQAILRAAKWIKYAADRWASLGYQYFTGPHEASRALLSHFYPTSGLPGTRSRSQLDGAAYGYSWTFWTHAGRALR